MEKTHMTDDLTGAEQKIPDWPIKITFLVKVETVISIGIKLRVGMGFSTSDTILCLWFSSLTMPQTIKGIK